MKHSVVYGLANIMENETWNDGEFLPTVREIWSRYYNNGDKMRESYGCETVNPAVRFLDCVSDDVEVTPRFKFVCSDFNGSPMSWRIVQPERRNVEYY